MEFLRKRLDWTQNMKKNQDRPCTTYLEMKSRQAKGEQIYDGEFAGLNAGHGVYFAADPILSRTFGDYLVAVAIPPGTEFAHFDPAFKFDELKTAELMFTQHKGIVFLWNFESPAVVLRDMSVLGKKPKVWSADLSLTTPFVPLERLRVPRNSVNIKKYLQTFRNYLLWAANDENTRTATEAHFISWLLAFQFKRMKEESLLNQVEISFETESNILQMLNSRPVKPNDAASWAKLVSTVQKLGWLSEKRAKKINVNDPETMKKAILEDFSKGPGGRAARSFYHFTKRSINSKQNVARWTVKQH